MAAASLAGDGDFRDRGDPDSMGPRSRRCNAVSTRRSTPDSASPCSCRRTSCRAGRRPR